MHLVFVYGTLKRGFPNYDAYLADARFRGTYQTVEKYCLVINGPHHVPCLLDRPGEGFAVSGELFEVDDARLKKIDRLEQVGQPGGYRRATIRIVPEENPAAMPLSAQVYLMDPQRVTDRRSAVLKTYRREDAVKYRPR